MLLTFLIIVVLIKLDKERNKYVMPIVMYPKSSNPSFLRIYAERLLHDSIDVKRKRNPTDNTVTMPKFVKIIFSQIYYNFI